MKPESAMQRHIYYCDARSRQDVAPGITEREWLRVRERLCVEPLLRGPLICRPVQALAGNDVGPIRRSGICEIRHEIHRVLGRAILKRQDPEAPPVGKKWPKEA